MIAAGSARVVSRAVSVEAVPALVASPVRRRAPAWRAPTRWAHPPKRRSAAPFVLLALIAIAGVLVSTGVIDIDAWREILATYVG